MLPFQTLKQEIAWQKHNCNMNAPSIKTLNADKHPFPPSVGIVGVAG